MITLDIDVDVRTKTEISVETDYISRLDWNGILITQRGDV
jgi:hypothetical protein